MLRRLLSLMAVMAAAIPAYGQALEIGEGSSLTIETLTVRADVDEGIALVDIDQTFRNGTDAVQEGTYRFRLPEKAVVHSFSMWIQGKEKHGQVLEAQRARRIYDQIVASKKDPALLEEIGWRMFKVSVFPIPARDTVRIRLVYAHVVDDDLGLRTLEIPMPEGVPVGVADVSINVRDKQGVAILDCPTHAQAQILHDDVMGAVRWSQEGFAPQGPIQVRSAPNVDGVGMALLAHRLEEAAEGTFLIRVVPRLDDVPEVPRDVVFVVDRSGSMKGQKMEQARAALLHGLSTLKDGDRFSIIAFSSGTQILSTDGLRPANATWLEKGKSFAQRLNASGGTNIDGALELATSMKTRDDSRLFVVSFLTDGQPTVGEKRPATIVENYRVRSGGDVRLFAFGVGNGVKDFLLTQLANVSHGAAEYVREDEDLEVKLSAFFDKVESPVLTDVAVNILGDGVQVLSTEPERMPDVFRGTAVVMAGRYTGSGPVRMELTGRIGATPVTVMLDGDFPLAAGSKPHVAQLWARMRIDRLLEDLRLHGMVQEIRDEIVRLGLRYQVVTPYTSFLIVEDDAHIPDDAELARVPEDAANPSAGNPDGGGETGGPVVGPGGPQTGGGSTASADPPDVVAPDSREPSDPPPAPEMGAPTTPGGETGGPTKGETSDSGGGGSSSSGGSYRGPSGEAPPSGREASGGGGGGGGPTTGGGDVGGPSSESSSGASAGGGGGGGAAPSTGGAGRPSGAANRRDYSWWTFWWKFHGEALRDGDQRVATAVSPEVMRDVVLPVLRRQALSSDVNWYVRRESQRALRRLGDATDAVRALEVRMLLDRRADGEQSFHGACQESAARLLVDGAALSSTDRARLITVLGTTQRKGNFTREYSALALGLGGPDASGNTVNALLAAADRGDTRWLRSTAIFALGLLGDARAVPALSTAFDSGAWNDNELSDIELTHVVDALGRIGDPGPAGAVLGSSAVVSALEKALRNRSRRRRSIVAVRAIPAALARLAPRASGASQKRIVSALVEARKVGRDPSLSNFATIALGRVAACPDVAPASRKAARKALLHVWRRTRREPVPFVALALGIAASGPEGGELLAPLRGGLSESTDLDTRAACAAALGLQRDRDSFEELLSVGRDPGADRTLRMRALEAVAAIGDDREIVRTVLRDRLESEIGDVALTIAGTLAALGDSSVFDAHLEQFEEGNDDFEWLANSAALLGRHGGDEAARRLAAVAADVDRRLPDVTRGMAALALGRMGMGDDRRMRIAEDFPYRAYTPVVWDFMNWR